MASTVARRVLTSAVRPLRFSSTLSQSVRQDVPLFPLAVPFFPGEKEHIYVFEPRYHLMLEKIMKQPPEKRFMGLVKLNSDSFSHVEGAEGNDGEQDAEDGGVVAMQTEWRSSKKGTLVRLDGEPRQAGFSQDNVIVDFKGVERFEVAHPKRDKYGFWTGDLARITDNALSPQELRQAHLLAQGVQSLMWEYAKLVIQSNTLVLDRFKSRMVHMLNMGLTPFSFWICLQLKACYPDSHKGIEEVQGLLEQQSLIERLTTQSAMLLDRIQAEGGNVRAPSSRKNDSAVPNAAAQNKEATTAT